MLFTTENLIAFISLVSLEIVLGIDNIIFISILASKLPPELRQKARTIGLGLAMGTRILLLLSISWVMKLTKPLLDFGFAAFSGRDLILLFGGLFLIAKSTVEIHKSITHEESTEEHGAGKIKSFGAVLVQIAIIDVIFSLDSVITAVGLVDQVSIMIAAVVISVIVMMVSVKSISDFVDENPTVKMLALSFLIVVGITLVGESFGQHIPKGYIYFAMFYSLMVEMLNLKMRKKQKAK